MASITPTVLVYHMVDPHFYWGITRVTPRQFERQIRFLSEQDYSTCNLLESTAQRGGQIDRRVCITFDDSYETTFEYAFPILEKYNMKATLFVISRYVGKWNAWDVIIGGKRLRHLDWHKLRELHSHGWNIGSHGASHRDLTSLTRQKLGEELKNSKALLEDRLGAPVDFLSYPFGQFNQKVIDAVKDAGFKAACAMMFSDAWNGRRFWPYTIPRRSIYLIDTMRDFASKLNSTERYNFQKLKERMLSFGCKGTILVSR